MYQLHRRNDNTLLVNLTERTDTRRRTAAHIDMMGNIGDITERLVVVVDGRNEGHVIEVAAASIRIVDQECIAWTEVFNPIIDDGLRDQLNQRPPNGWADRTIALLTATRDRKRRRRSLHGS